MSLKRYAYSSALLKKLQHPAIPDHRALLHLSMLRFERLHYGFRNVPSPMNLWTPP